ncbi:MAG: hypothetical protein BGO78_01280 [Chloroflexi bacterium 44-23]|nr:MAG: hypothetical protein BGO78_01280 [Chloroflexi bacterium 44-23]
MNILTNRVERTRFLKFGFVGLIGAIIDFGIFNLVSSLTPLSALVASIISFVAAVLSNFLWNRYWTYPDSRLKAFANQLTQFVIVSVVGLIIRVILFTPIESIILQFTNRIIDPQFIFSPQIIGHNITLAILIVIVMFWNFFANRYWTYNDVK